MNHEQTNIIEKIHGLMRKTVARGCTQEEANAAVAHIAKLKAKYGILHVPEDDGDGPASKVEFSFRTEEYRMVREKDETDIWIPQVLQQCFQVKVFHDSYWDYNERKGQYTKRMIYLFAGEEMDIAIARVVADLLHGVMTNTFDTCGADFMIASVTDLKHSFYQGFVVGVINAYQRAHQQQVRLAILSAADKYALVLIDKAKALDKFQKEAVESHEVDGPDFRRDYLAFMVGNREGEKLDIKISDKL